MTIISECAGTRTQAHTYTAQHHHRRRSRVSIVACGEVIVAQVVVVVEHSVVVVAHSASWAQQ